MYDYFVGTNESDAKREFESWCDPISQVDWEAVLVRDDRGYHVLVAPRR